MSTTRPSGADPDPAGPTEPARPVGAAGSSSGPTTSGPTSSRPTDSSPTGPTRRGFLGRTGAVGGAAVAGVVGGAAVGRWVIPDASAHTAVADGEGPAASALTAVPATGVHQAGIVDRPPAHLRFTAFDLRPTSSATAARAALQQTMRAWSEVATQVAQGRWATTQDEVTDGLRPAHVTTTIGLGASGLQAAGLPVPAALAPLPTFNNDLLDPARSNGDFAVQVCAEDAQTAASITRALVTAAAVAALPRWQQIGFLPGAAATADITRTRRNLMGQFDGSGNPTGAALDTAVWVPDDGGGANGDAATGDAPWMIGGTYLVSRRIRMMLDSWERLSTSAQERVIGRSRSTGAPLGRQRESDEMDFALAGPDGVPLVPANAHVRLVHPDFNNGAQMLRRAYAFDDGFDDRGADAGLFFQCFQTDPRTVFVPIQVKLAALDALTPFVRHEASSLFAIPPGFGAGAAGAPSAAGAAGGDDYVAQSLFES